MYLATAKKRVVGPAAKNAYLQLNHPGPSNDHGSFAVGSQAVLQREAGCCAALRAVSERVGGQRVGGGEGARSRRRASGARPHAAAGGEGAELLLVERPWTSS
jgi:hypothetical protein